MTDLSYRERVALQLLRAGYGEWFNGLCIGPNLTLADAAIDAIRSVIIGDDPPPSLGEQPHDPTNCVGNGRPHVGACADPRSLAGMSYMDLRAAFNGELYHKLGDMP